MQGAEPCHDGRVTPSPASGIRVLVVDGNELFCRGLAALLDTLDDFSAVGAAVSSPEAAALARETSAQVVLMDVSLGQDSGIELCALLKAESPETKVVMLTTSESGTDLYESVQAGASGYLLKSSSFSELAQAVRAVWRGQSMISPVMASALLEEFRRANDPQPTPRRKLSERELEVLGQVARGLNNRDVARTLGISENTVKNHMRSILDKLKLRSRTEAAMYAVREKLVEW